MRACLPCFYIYIYIHIYIYKCVRQKPSCAVTPCFPFRWDTLPTLNNPFHLFKNMFVFSLLVLRESSTTGHIFSILSRGRKSNWRTRNMFCQNPRQVWEEDGACHHALMSLAPSPDFGFRGMGMQEAKPSKGTRCTASFLKGKPVQRLVAK